MTSTLVVPRRLRRVGAAAIVLALAGCTHPHVARVEAFRSAKDAGDLETARTYLAADPRVWYGQRSGAGEPWTLGAGRWKAWDEHFHGVATLGSWHVADDHVWTVATEMNDYFRLVERRDTPRFRLTYFLDDDDRITGYLISSADPGPARARSESRFDEFEAWVTAHHADEWAALRPGGQIDPTGDFAPRTRALLNEWRRSVGLPTIE